ncbi:MAG: Diaminopimelate epimerase [Thermoanaerobaculia bacterium]|nr:Diaminopimelate epimerase [Thermoanaerobaculia bacterium]
MNASGTGSVSVLPRFFTKMSGAGNDFLVFRGPAPTAPDLGAAPYLGAAIQAVCRRGMSVGADGVLFVEALPSAGGPPSCRLEYFNADGGRARFCGNGTRCAARFAADRLFSGCTSVIVHTGWGPVPARIDVAGRVTLDLPESVGPGSYVSSLDAGGEFLEEKAYFLLAGVPHLAVFLRPGKDLRDLDVRGLGPRLRHHPELPEGANVNFLAVTGPSDLAIRTFERGVEAETLACGSGVVASAVTAALTRDMAPPLSLLTRSGAVLHVGFELSGNEATGVTLSGDARFIFEGELTEEAL